MFRRRRWFQRVWRAFKRKLGRLTQITFLLGSAFGPFAPPPPPPPPPPIEDADGDGDGDRER